MRSRLYLLLAASVHWGVVCGAGAPYTYSHHTMHTTHEQKHAAKQMREYTKAVKKAQESIDTVQMIAANVFDPAVMTTGALPLQVATGVAPADPAEVQAPEGAHIAFPPPQTMSAAQAAYPSLLAPLQLQLSRGQERAANRAQKLRMQTTPYVPPAQFMRMPPLPPARLIVRQPIPPTENEAGTTEPQGKDDVTELEDAFAVLQKMASGEFVWDPLGEARRKEIQDALVELRQYKLATKGVDLVTGNTTMGRNAVFDNPVFVERHGGPLFIIQNPRRPGGGFPPRIIGAEAGDDETEPVGDAVEAPKYDYVPFATVKRDGTVTVMGPRQAPDVAGGPLANAATLRSLPNTGTLPNAHTFNAHALANAHTAANAQTPATGQVEVIRDFAERWAEWNPSSVAQGDSGRHLDVHREKERENAHGDGVSKDPVLIPRETRGDAVSRGDVGPRHGDMKPREGAMRPRTLRGGSPSGGGFTFDRQNA